MASPLTFRQGRFRNRALWLQFNAAGLLVGLAFALGLAALAGTVEPRLALAIGLGLLAILAVLLRRLYVLIAQPIAALSQGMRRYREGELKVRVPVTSRSEIGFLERSFNDLAEKLEAMVRDLRRLDELKTEFISTVSHELRTPLTSIGGYTKLLAAGDTGPVNDTQKEFLEIIDANVERLTELINDLLDVEKVRAGKLALAFGPVDLNEVLQSCRATFELVAAKKGLTLKMPPAGSGILVQGDRARLTQVVANLISNAVKYTEKGQIEIELVVRSFAVLLKVRDTGIGMSSEDQEKIFQRFYRTRSALASGQGGTGLGLAITRALVEAHGGRISMTSEKGRGSVFTVALPLPETSARLGVGARSAVYHDEEVASVWIIGASDAHAGLIEEWLLSDFDLALSAGGGFRIERFASMASLAGEGGRAPILIIAELASADTERELQAALRERMRIVSPLLTRIADQGLPEESAFLESVHRVLARDARRILVADGDHELRALIKTSLQRRGFVVDEAERGSEVLERIGEGGGDHNPYELLLVALELPDVPARELLSTLRGRRLTPRLPVFVMLGQDPAQSKFAPLTPSEAGKASPRERMLELGKLGMLGADQFVGKYEGIGGIVDAVHEFLEPGPGAS